MAGQTSGKTNTSVLVVGNAVIDVPLTLPDLANLRRQLEASLAAVDQEISRRRNADDRTLVSGTAMQHLQPDTGDVTWSEEKNARRFELIDKQIQKTITGDEQVELRQLTQLMRAHLDNEATVPLEGARRLHAELLKKKPIGTKIE